MTPTEKAMTPSSDTPWPPVCATHPRWTYGCEECERVGHYRRLIRLHSGLCSAGDEDWIIDPNLC